MQMSAGSREAVKVRVYGPAGVDLSVLTGVLAVMPDDGTEPGDADLIEASWLPDKTTLAAVVGFESANPLEAGDYMVWGRITTGTGLATDEQPLKPAGRLRVGDVRT
jgi:hypothetical protein